MSSGPFSATSYRWLQYLHLEDLSSSGMWPEIICFHIATEYIERLIARPQLNQTLGTYQMMLTRAEVIILVGVVRRTSQTVLGLSVLAALVP